jgi:hypothetical protein
MYKNNLIIIIAATVTLLSGCAKISAPTGGPQDSEPPKVLKTVPENGSTRFSDKHIRFYFDEFITINNPTENVLISPPMSTPPEYTIKGKSLDIIIKDTLRENTTYNMVFSDCIKDYHESNALSFFHFSFSTGDSLDDYMIQGKVIDAKTLAPSKDFFVLIYKNADDSMPLTTLPNYVTKSLADGSFSFRNITPGNYKIFALKDINSDMLYNLPNEEIAFLNETVSSYQALPDSAADSLKAALPKITLVSFAAEDTVQKLFRYDNPAAGIYRFPYKLRINKFNAVPVSTALEYFEQINSTRDTITWYLKTPIEDTVTYYFHADNQIDTIRIIPFKEKQQGRGRGNQPVKRLPVSFLNGGECHKPLTLQFGYPVRPTDSFNVYVYSQQQNVKDTTVYRYAVPDTFTTKLPLPMNFTEKKSYSVMIPDSVFFGYNNLTNDTLKTQFNTKSVKDYGTLIMNYQLPNDGKQYVATLWNKNNILQEDILSASKTITYTFLAPDAYQVSVFCDDNGNGRWDPGNYHKHLHPEKMYFFPNIINIRAFWDSEENFVIEN